MTPAGGLVVVTANVQQGLSSSAATRTLGQVLDTGPDVVGLQEWYPRRWRLLTRSGSLRPVPGTRLRLGGAQGGRMGWYAGVVGGCVVGLDRRRFRLTGCEPLVLSRAGRADRGDTRLGLEAARVAVVARAEERATGRRLAVLGYHLVHGVQRSGRYREDRPRLADRHRAEVARLSAAVERLRRDGDLVLALGDSNFHGLRLPGLMSAWAGAESGAGSASEEGTLGRRQVDDVHASSAASSLETLVTPSDHRALVVRYPAPGRW